MQGRSSILAAIIFLFAFTLWHRLLMAQCTSGTVCSCQDCPIERQAREGNWFVVQTANFRVYSEHSRVPAANLARHAEALRIALRSKWLRKEPDKVWNPRCRIVLHSSRQRYVAVVGRGSERTVGSSLVKVDKNRITERRIDLLGGQSEYLTAALPHELTHVVLRERFVSVPLPCWADEGLAILADPPAKQRGHFKDLKDSLERNTTFQAASLLSLDGYPPAGRVGTFYGQSASLVQYLVVRESPQRFVEFIERSERVGYEDALRQCYGIASMADLDRLWRRQLQSVELALSPGK